MICPCNNIMRGKTMLLSNHQQQHHHRTVSYTNIINNNVLRSNGTYVNVYLLVGRHIANTYLSFEARLHKRVRRPVMLRFWSVKDISNRN